jgi:hypothetical protein
MSDSTVDEFESPVPEGDEYARRETQEQSHQSVEESNSIDNGLDSGGKSEAVPLLST